MGIRAILKILHAIIVKKLARISSLSRLLFSLYFTENWLQTCQTVLKNVRKIVMISHDYHNIVRLLLLTIIANK